MLKGLVTRSVSFVQRPAFARTDTPIVLVDKVIHYHKWRYTTKVDVCVGFLLEFKFRVPLSYRITVNP